MERRQNLTEVFYQKVIADTIKNASPHFIANSKSDAILQTIETLWKQKLFNSTQPPPPTYPPTSYGMGYGAMSSSFPSLMTNLPPLNMAAYSLNPQLPTMSHSSQYMSMPTQYQYNLNLNFRAAGQHPHQANRYKNDGGSENSDSESDEDDPDAQYFGGQGTEGVKLELKTEIPSTETSSKPFLGKHPRITIKPELDSPTNIPSTPDDLISKSPSLFSTQLTQQPQPLTAHSLSLLTPPPMTSAQLTRAKYIEEAKLKSEKLTKAEDEASQSSDLDSVSLSDGEIST